MSKLQRISFIGRRIIANGAAAAVGGVAARATWSHIVMVGQRYGEEMAFLLPVSVDGMMVAGVVLQVDARIMGRRNPWARFCTWLGGLMSVGFQVESGRTRGWVAMVIASIFSITLIATVEALAYAAKKKAQAIQQVTAPAVVPVAQPTPAPAPVVVTSTAPVPAAVIPQSPAVVVGPAVPATLGGRSRLAGGAVPSPLNPGRVLTERPPIQ